jgi:hypothetical protein
MKWWWLLVVACGSSAARTPTQLLWRIDLPGAIPEAIARNADGSYAVELTIDQPLALGVKTLTPRAPHDHVVVTIGGDGQPTGGDYGTIAGGDASIADRLAIDAPIRPRAAIALDDGGAIVGGTCEEVGCLVRVIPR